jgi:hypothetical protein
MIPVRFSKTPPVVPPFEHAGSGESQEPTNGQYRYWTFTVATTDVDGSGSVYDETHVLGDWIVGGPDDSLLEQVVTVTVAPLGREQVSPWVVVLLQSLVNILVTSLGPATDTMPFTDPCPKYAELCSACCTTDRVASVSVIQAKNSPPEFTTLRLTMNSTGRTKADSIIACPRSSFLLIEFLLAVRSATDQGHLRYL